MCASRGDEQICTGCGKPVSSSEDEFNLFENMHWICFHFEFEHGDHDKDEPCEDPSCPWNRINNSSKVLGEVHDSLSGLCNILDWGSEEDIQLRKHLVDIAALNLKNR